MGKYLSDDERKAVTAVDEFVGQLNCGLSDPSWGYAKPVADGHARDYVPDGYIDDDLARLATAFADCFGYFSRRVNRQDDVIIKIIECAEEVRLPAIEGLKILEDLPKQKKVVPSIAEFNEMFKERKELLQRAASESRNIVRDYRNEADRAFKALEDAVDGIRGFLPDFPDPEHLSEIWEPVFNAPFPVHEYGIAVPEFKKKMEKFRAGLQAGEFWPAVPLYCIYLAMQIPIEKLPAGIEYVEDIIRGEDGDYYASCNLPMHWHSAIAEIPNLPLEPRNAEFWECEDPRDAIYWWLESCYRDRINANWQAKLDAAPPIPQPTRQRQEELTND